MTNEEKKKIKKVPLNAKVTPNFKKQLQDISELENRSVSQTVEFYLKPIIENRLKELKQE